MGLVAEVPDAAELVEAERRVFRSAVGRAAEIASVIAVVVGDDEEGSKLWWAVGRRIR